MTKNYPSVWFKGLEGEDKQRLIHALSTSELSQRLQSILEDWERQLEVTSKDYDNPSWSHKQAHLNGMREAYTKIKNLFDQKGK